LEETLIFDIKHNSLDDGPGIRSVVFFKGCPLNCAWCQNPEGKKQTLELWWDDQKCIADGACMDVCPVNAISFDFQHFINRELCNNCFYCIEVCPSTALKPTAIGMSTDDIINRILPYKSYFETSGGGVTLSGGEATLNMPFVSVLLQKLKNIGIHTLLETSGHFDYEVFEKLVLPYIDEIYYDIKFIDPLEHKHWCGVDNKKILDNYKRLQKQSITQKFILSPRTALIPNITDTEANILEIAAFYSSISVPKTMLLPNNPMWLKKFDSLGIESNIADKESLRAIYPEDKKKLVVGYFKQYGIDVNFG